MMIVYCFLEPPVYTFFLIETKLNKINLKETLDPLYIIAIKDDLIK